MGAIAHGLSPKIRRGEGTPPYRILPAGERKDDAEDDDTEDDHGDHEKNHAFRSAVRHAVVFAVQTFTASHFRYLFDFRSA